MLVIFIIMDYEKIHNRIIERAKKENRRKGHGIYYETHHIIPKCMGGNNKKTNLILLTGKEHWLIHLLLIEIYPENIKLKIAMNKMIMKSNNQERSVIISGKQFERLRKMISDAHSKLLTGRKMKPFTDEHKLNLSKSMKGRVSPNKGKKLSEDTKIKIGLSSKNRISGEKNHMKRPEFREFMRNNNPMHRIENIGMFKNEKNPNAKKVTHIELKKTYNTIKECMGDLNLTRREFQKLVKNKIIKYD